MIGSLNENEIDDLLISQVIGRIGCHADARTLVVPVMFAYDGTRIIGHSAVGEKVHMMRANPQVCFEVDEIVNLRNWRSVVIQGRYSELEGHDAPIAMSFLIDKVMKMMPSETALLGSGGHPIRPQHPTGEGNSIIFCIQIDEKSGRFERT